MMKAVQTKAQKYIEIDGLYQGKLFFSIDFYEFEERAAILEFDFGVEFKEAARLSFNELIKKYAYLKGKIK
ncbi:MAG: hypothetical protein KIT33_07890 [Candidatus Kapabacteria bacterium]|nr:hypothetical protein [Ignavibacteriota bacterium]MCW5884875.1 hypothetical protein [Candidatus Kapabacteria bacterium]